MLPEFSLNSLGCLSCHFRSVSSTPSSVLALAQAHHIPPHRSLRSAVPTARNAFPEVCIEKSCLSWLLLAISALLPHRKGISPSASPVASVRADTCLELLNSAPISCPPCFTNSLRTGLCLIHLSLSNGDGGCWRVFVEMN